MPTDLTGDMIDVLACAYTKRPKDAPSFVDLQSAIRTVRREEGALTIEFDPATGDSVAELAAAERLCCPSIGFDISHTPAPMLRITATPAQLDIFEQFLTA